MDPNGILPIVPATISQDHPASDSEDEAPPNALDDMFDDMPAEAPAPAPPQITLKSPSPKSDSHPNPNNNSNDPTPSASRTPSPSRSRSTPQRSNSESGSPAAHRDGGRNPMEYDERDGEGEGMEREGQAEVVDLAMLPGLRGSDGQVWSLRLPPYTSFPLQPFHRELYRRNEIKEQEAQDAESGITQEMDEEKWRVRGMIRMQEVKGAIRWKWSDDGPGGMPIKKSNSRIIKWSDGTASLQIGEELFDVNVSSASSGAKPFGMPTAVNTAINSTPSGTPTKPILKKPTVNPDGAMSVIYKADFDAATLQADSILSGQIGLVPVTERVKNFQKKLNAITGSGLKKAKITLNTDESMEDPMKAAEARNKKFSERELKRLGLKSKSSTQAWQVRPMRSGRKDAEGEYEDDDDEEEPLGRGAGMGGRRDAAGAGKRRRREAADYDSDEDDDDEPASKRGARFEVGGGNVGEYEEDDFVVADESDEENEAEESNAEEEQEDDDDGEEDLELISRKERKKEKKKSKAIRRDFTPDEEGEKSELEVAEEAAERAEEERRRERKKEGKKRKSEAVVEEDDAMDIDDDEVIAAPIAKKRVAAYDSDEDD